MSPSCDRPGRYGYGWKDCENPFRLDTGLVDVQKVVIGLGKTIDKVAFHLTNGEKLVAGKNSGETVENFTVPVGETITKISVWKGHGIYAIQFHTHTTSSKIFGTLGGKCHEYEANHGEVLAWVDGRAGDYLRSIRFGWKIPERSTFQIDCRDSGVEKVLVREGRQLHQISLVCADGQKHTAGKSSGDLEKEFVVPKGQVIKKASVWQGKRTYALQFHTDEESSQIFGNQHASAEDWVDHEATVKGLELIGLEVEADTKIRFIWNYRWEAWHLRNEVGSVVLNLPLDILNRVQDPGELEVLVKRTVPGQGSLLVSDVFVPDEYAPSQADNSNEGDSCPSPNVEILDEAEIDRRRGRPKNRPKEWYMYPDTPPTPILSVLPSVGRSEHW